MKSLLFVLAILSVSNSAFAFDETSHSSPNQAITFSVGPDEALTYPTDLVNLPDEHTTVLPPKHHFDPYLFFASSSLKGGSGGAVALESFDLKTFDFTSGYQPHVMTPLSISQPASPSTTPSSTSTMRRQDRCCRTRLGLREI
jgi:hypothetical protein